jgi:hypothetical protein
VYSAVRSDKMVVLSVDITNLHNMLSQLTGGSVDLQAVMRLALPTNQDIITLVNDLALKSKIGPRYIINTDFAKYHPADHIFHQNKTMEHGYQAIVYIKDEFDDILMSGGEDCPGTRELVAYYKNAYKSLTSEILNKNSLFVRGDSGIFSVIERNLAEFITYLSWSKMNEIIKYAKSTKPDANFDLASSYELFEKSNGVVFDIVRTLKEHKDSSFYLLDGKSGSKIKVVVDGGVPDTTNDEIAAYYHSEFIRNTKAYRAGSMQVLEKAVKNANERIRKSMSVGVKTGMVLSRTLMKQGWEMKEVDGVDCFVYPNTLYINSAIGGAGMKKYIFPDECHNLLYLYDITVPIDSVLVSGLSTSDPRRGVRARGLSPHRASGGSGDVISDLNHASDLTKVCIGDLDGKPIESIVDMLDALSVAYEPSMMGNLPTRCIMLLFGRDVEIMSSSASDADHKATVKFLQPFVKNKGSALKPKKPASSSDKADKAEIKVKEKVMRSGTAIFSTGG